ncbi:unnamed protein product (macronuclear) [Paramecium tetraurelia]|uniref:GOLD domain-containing protein n=1 Tax=Paramecium tetraurelia TaxID=5888 RepID=A0CLE7_PARTE|nr:uncharacterized protein GSPATT00008162001 [Paramecium tetraurelia]CAK71614.1 unnamed protein product [Paramecium tetraurelia]|eukprot:XP_001439011.1 hypothetical protein (macronuclear) [Paramecium tetraurelia strain d4-2]
MKYLLIISTLIVLGQSLSTQLSQQPSCFLVNSPEENSNLTVNYIVSGLDENQTDVFIRKKDGEILIKIQNSRDGRIRELLKDKDNYYVCFQSRDKSYKMVSFDFDIEGVDKEYAQSEQFDEMSKELQNTQKNFQNIYRNQHWISDRENTHALVLDQTEKSVQWYALIKVGVLIVISSAQIYIVYNYFKDKDFSGQV